MMSLAYEAVWHVWYSGKILGIETENRHSNDVKKAWSVEEVVIGSLSFTSAYPLQSGLL